LTGCKKEWALLIDQKFLTATTIGNSSAEQHIDRANTLALADCPHDWGREATGKQQLPSLGRGGAMQETGLEPWPGSKIKNGIMLSEAIGQDLRIPINQGLMIMKDQTLPGGGLGIKPRSGPHAMTLSHWH
jgi:hypothetical protein